MRLPRFVTNDDDDAGVRRSSHKGKRCLVMCAKRNSYNYNYIKGLANQCVVKVDPLRPNFLGKSANMSTITNVTENKEGHHPQ